SQAAMVESKLNFHCEQAQLPEMTLSFNQNLKKLILTFKQGTTDFSATGMVDKESYSLYQDNYGNQKIKVLVNNDQLNATVKLDKDVDANFPEGVALISLCIRQK
ncbi:MAG: hypothetical protein ACXVB1_16700, partial [Pseudobdellovibrionaceae bacterium]